MTDAPLLDPIRAALAEEAAAVTGAPPPAAGGHDPDSLDVPLVSLVELGEANMGKRAGTVVTLRELIDDIGVDAARFFLVQRSHETSLDLDLDLAREQSQENPVCCVRYAHARVCSIIA